MSNTNKQIAELEAGTWATLEVEVLEIWEHEHPSIRQTGLLRDETGIIKFVAWEKSNKPLIEEGATYKLVGMPVTQYEEYMSVAIVSSTTITRTGTVQTEIPTV